MHLSSKVSKHFYCATLIFGIALLLSQLAPCSIPAESREKVSTSALVLYQRGLECEGKKQWREALNLFLKATALDAKNAPAWIELGGCYSELRDFRDAERCFLYASTKLALNKELLKTCLQGLLVCETANGELDAIQKTRKDYVANFPRDPYSKELTAAIEYYSSDFLQTKTEEKYGAPRYLFSPWLKHDDMPHYPIRVSIGPSKSLKPNKMYTAAAEKKYTALARKAFCAWQAAIGPPMLFDLNADPKTAQISCEWTNDSNERKHGFTTAGHCDFVGRNYSSGKFRVLIFIDRNVTQSDNVFYQTCSHEIGHALGLSHSSHPEDVMYYSRRSSIFDLFAAPSTNDASRAKSIYTEPFQAANIAIQFANAAYAEHDYSKAYNWLTIEQRSKKSLEQFEQEMTSKEASFRPTSIVIHQRYYSDVHRQHTNFMLLGKDQKNDRKYYSINLLKNPDGTFGVTNASEDN